MKYLLPITAAAALVAFVIYQKRKEKTHWIQIIKNGGITANPGKFKLGQDEHIIAFDNFLNDEVGY